MLLTFFEFQSLLIREGKQSPYFVQLQEIFNAVEYGSIAWGRIG